jgi:hypothetical protein
MSSHFFFFLFSFVFVYRPTFSLFFISPRVYIFIHWTMCMAYNFCLVGHQQQLQSGWQQEPCASSTLVSIQVHIIGLPCY